MTCPKCRTDVRDSSVCEVCGLRLVRSMAGVMKTSAVLIAAGGKKRFFSSVHELPGHLRLQLEAATNGSNSGTILIADKAGRERIRIEAGNSRLVEADAPAESASARPSWVVWAGLALLALAIAIIVIVWG